jgi:chemotaxis response regulator CheB
MTPAFDIVALVTSAGGLEALSRVLGGFADDFPCRSSCCSPWPGMAAVS